MRKAKNTDRSSVHWPSLITALSNTKTHIGHLLAFSFSINLLVLAVPVLMIEVFDHVLISQSLGTLAVLAIAAIAALIVVSVLDFVRGRILSRAALKLEDSLRQDLLTKERQARLGDVAKLRQFIAGPMMITALDALWVPLFLLAIFMLHSTLGLIAMAGVMLLLGMAITAERWTHGPLQEALTAERHISTFTQNLKNDDGSTIVHGLELKLADQRRKAQANIDKQRLIAADRMHTASVIGRFVRIALQGTLMMVATALVIAGQITPGAMVAACVIAARAFAPVERAQELARSLAETRAALMRLMTTHVDASPEISGFPVAPSPRLNVQHIGVLNKTTREPLFSNVNFTARGGEMIGITGQSGSGKSVLAKLIVGLDMPTQGKVTLDQNDISRITLERARTDIAYLPQSPKLHAGTIADNISRYGDSQSPEIYNAARFAGAEESILELPYGYMTEVGPDMPELPKALVQRILMARTFFDDPRLIVLDEPYTFLDNKAIGRMISTLNHFKSTGSIIIVISQRPSLLAQCDRVMVLENQKARPITRANSAKLTLVENKDAKPAPATLSRSHLHSAAE